VKDLVFLIFL